MAKKKVEHREPGVELHGNNYRFRERIMVDGVTKKGDYKRWPFVANDSKSQRLALDHANAYAIKARHERGKPYKKGGLRDAEGTLMEWLLRYQCEALDGRLYDGRVMPVLVERIYQRIDGVSGEEEDLNLAPFPRSHRSQAGIEVDKSHIRSMFRLARDYPEIDDILRSPVDALGSADIKRLLDAWANGKAKRATKGRVIDTLSMAWAHHAINYSMKAHKPWQDLRIEGDGEKPKARAIPAHELKSIEREFNRLHPYVRGAIEFLRWTGARRGEAVKLEWKNIKWPPAGSDQQAPAVLLERTKATRGTYRERSTYLEDGGVLALARMVHEIEKPGELFDEEAFEASTFAWPKKGRVFRSPKNPSEPLAAGTISQAFKRSVEHAGVPHASVHHLRHTKATVLTATVPQAIAQELLGHEDSASFERYRHLAEEAGYMVRTKHGELVSKEQLRSTENIIEALKGLPKADRAAVLSALMAD